MINNAAMVKKILLLGMVVCLFACNNREEITSPGYLSLDKVELSCDGEIIPATKAVDNTLKIEIIQQGSIVASYDPATTPERIELDPGDFVLHAFSVNKEEPQDGNWEPHFETFQDFVIQQGELTSIRAVALQTNVGVFVAYSDEFKENFTDMSVTVSSSTRTAIIDGEDKGLWFFAVPEDGLLRYRVTAVNHDQEVFISEERIISDVQAKRYKITVDL